MRNIKTIVLNAFKNPLKMKKLKLFTIVSLVTFIIAVLIGNMPIV